MPDTMEEEDAAPVVRILHAPPSTYQLAPAYTTTRHTAHTCVTSRQRLLSRLTTVEHAW
eukprot:COSAG01_NODE_50098_length_366_cov_0.955056_1_plen_58_part_01